MITYRKLAEKFEDKGYPSEYLFFMLPSMPLFDPCITQLQYASREELKRRFDESSTMVAYRKSLEDLDIWIDHQTHKF